MKASATRLIGTGLLVAILMALPVIRWILVPVQYLNTHIHELFHALAALGTGGLVRHIEVFTDGSGVTLTAGGFAPLISSAGYIGAAIVGAIMIASTRTPQGARQTLRMIGVLMLFSTLVFVRGNLFGFASGLIWASLLLVLASKLKNEHVQFWTAFLGMLQCLNSLKSLLDLNLLSAGSPVATDAMNMQNLTQVPALVWAVMWSLLGVVGISYGFFRALGHKSAPHTAK